MRQSLPLALLFVASPFLYAQGWVNFVIPTHPISPVAGAPYCADEVFEHQQTLNDGTHINQTINTQHICRDSAGRTRTERMHGSNRAAGLKIVEIRDPVAGFMYALDSQNSIAHRAKLPVANASVPLRVPAERIARREVSDSADTSQPQFTRESLGTRMIDGVKVEGTLSKTVYPANSQGNDQPITVTRETWLSPQLQLDVKSVRSDPRSGEQINRLDNLTATEPDPSLFQVPAGYQIVDETSNFKIQY